MSGNESVETGPTWRSVGGGIVGIDLLGRCLFPVCFNGFCVERRALVMQL